MSVALFFFSITIHSAAQLKSFKIDSHADSLWIRQLITYQAATQAPGEIKEMKLATGKVFYSSDRFLRIGQISFSDDYSDLHYAATVQYYFREKLAEEKLPDEFDFQFFPISLIYKMPNDQASYLVIGTSFEENNGSPQNWMSDFLSQWNPSLKNDQHDIKIINKVANLIMPASDSLKKSGSSIWYQSLTNSLPQSPEPYFIYDSLKNQINLLRLACDHDNLQEKCAVPYLRVYTATYDCHANGFELIKDISGFYPALESFTDTISTKKYKVGGYKIKATLITSLEEMGEAVLPVRTVSYSINDQTYNEFDNILDDTLKSTRPDCRRQQDSSLILLLHNKINYNAKGMCGACDYYIYEFWSVKNKMSKKILLVSDNAGSGFTQYEYYDDSTITGNLNLYKDSNEEGQTDSAYWQNNSTYVFRKSDGHFFRNFYIHFDHRKGKTVARFTIGKLIKRETE